MSENLETTMLDVNFDDAYDFELLGDDEEVEVQVTKAEIHRSQKGNVSLHLVLTVPSNPRVDDIHVYVGVPPRELQAEDPKAYNKRLVQMGRVYDAFKIDKARREIDVQEFVGQTAFGIASFEPGDGNFGDRNGIKRWVTGA